MLFLTCPKCGSRYERHPLTPAAQELCPACRNAASWDEIRSVLSSAASAASAAEAGNSERDIKAVTLNSSVDSNTSSSFGTTSGSAFGSERLSNSFVSAKLAAGRGQNSPFAPRVPLSELAIAAQRESDLLAAGNLTALSESESDNAEYAAPQSGATIAVAAPIKLAPHQTEIPLLTSGMEPAPSIMRGLSQALGASAAPASNNNFAFSIPVAAPVIGIQAPDVCGG